MMNERNKKKLDEKEKIESNSNHESNDHKSEL